MESASDEDSHCHTAGVFGDGVSKGMKSSSQRGASRPVTPASDPRRHTHLTPNVPGREAGRITARAGLRALGLLLPRLPSTQVTFRGSSPDSLLTSRTILRCQHRPWDSAGQAEGAGPPEGRTGRLHTSEARTCLCSRVRGMDGRPARRRPAAPARSVLERQLSRRAPSRCQLGRTSPTPADVTF